MFVQRFMLFLIAFSFLSLGFAWGETLNGPLSAPERAITAEGSFEVTGFQVLEPECQKTSVTISGTLTGTTDDGDGYDQVTFELWDDGELKDSKDVSVRVGETININITLAFDSLYGTLAPGVGVLVNDNGNYIFILDPFYPQDIEGECMDTYTLSVSRVGPGTGTVTSTPPGIDCGSVCSALFAPGTDVTLHAVPAEGSVFVSWQGGDCDGLTTDTCQVHMDASKSVTAIFDEGGAQEIATFTVYFDWDRYMEFYNTCLHVYGDQTFTTDDGYAGLWEVWQGVVYLNYTNGCAPVYTFSMSTLHGFMKCTDGQQGPEELPGYAYAVPGCEGGYTITGPTTAAPK